MCEQKSLICQKHADEDQILQGIRVITLVGDDGVQPLIDCLVGSPPRLALVGIFAKDAIAFI